MATWFNLALIARQIGDRWYPAGNGSLPLLRQRCTLRKGGGLLSSGAPSRSPGRSRPSASWACFVPEPRLVLHISDPLAGDIFLPMAGPLETNYEWPKVPIERLKASGQLAPVRNCYVHEIGPS